MYSIINGIPQKYILRYLIDKGAISAGTPSKFTIGFAIILPITAIVMPLISASTTDVCAVLLTPSASLAPVYLDIMTLAPTEIPTNRLIISPTTGALLPTAAMEFLPTKVPRTATSAALNNC